MTTTHRWRAFGVLAVAYFMTIIDLTIVNVALPTIGEKLHFSPANLQWVVTAYGITFGGLLLLAGRVADLVGRRRMFMLGLALFTAASLACALSRDDTVFVLMRAIQGIGAATVLPAALSIVTTMFAEGAERNTALGAWGALGPAGATVGLIGGGLLTRYLSWEYIFFLNVPIGLTALALTPRLVPESRRQSATRHYDVPGGLAVTAALMLAVYAISTAPQDGWSSAKTISLLALTGLLLAAFFVIESRAAQPLLPLRLLQGRFVGGANAVALTLGGGFYAFLFVGTLYMQQVLGYSALLTGCAWLGASLTSVLLAGLSQLLVTRIGPRAVLGAGMVLVAVGIALATRAPVHGHFWADLAAPIIIAGAGTAFTFIPISIAGLTGVAAHEAGLASGLVNTTQQLGGSLVVAVAASVAASRTASLLAGGHARTAALTGGFHAAFAVCAGIAALGVVLSRIVPKSAPTTELDTDDPRLGAPAELAS